MYERVKNPDFWRMVRTEDKFQDIRDRIRAEWESNCECEIPSLTYSKFQAFFKSGSREAFDKPYRLRRTQLGVAGLMALLYPEEEKYMEFLLDVMWTILDEFSWGVPQHIQFCPGDPVQDIELSAAETALQIAEINELLGDRLPDLVKKRIREELDRRIVQGYLNNTYLWENNDNNWSMVCLCGVIGVFTYVCPERVMDLLPRIRGTVKSYFAAYKNDGVCLEGTGYWAYGMLNFTKLSDLLYEFSNGDVDLYSEMYEDNPEKLINMLTFYQKVDLGFGTWVTFDDISFERGNNNTQLFYYIHNRFPELMPNLSEEHLSVGAARDYFSAYLREIMWFPKATNKLKKQKHVCSYMEDTGWFIKTTPNYGFAAKGGHIHRPYHADAGTFIVATEGGQIIADPGAGGYTKDYFDKDKRYGIFHVSSRGHCCPIIDGKYQNPDLDAVAVTSYEEGVFSVDLSNVYAVSTLNAFTRQFKFNDNQITVNDEWSFDGENKSVVERFILTMPPKMTEEGICVGPLLLISDKKYFECIQVSRETFQDGMDLYCLDYLLEKDQCEFLLKISLHGSGA